MESICASAGRDVESATRPLMAPIYQGSVFEVESLELLDDIYAGSQDGFIYSRDANPNVENLERVVAELENADDAVAFASGMGAIGNTLLSMVEAGDTVLAGDVLYGGTNLLLRQHLPRLGVRVEFVDVTDLGLVERALERSPKVILVESITNPLLRLTDVEGIARLAGESGRAGGSGQHAGDAAVDAAPGNGSGRGNPQRYEASRRALGRDGRGGGGDGSRQWRRYGSRTGFGEVRWTRSRLGSSSGGFGRCRCGWLGSCENAMRAAEFLSGERGGVGGPLSGAGRVIRSMSWRNRRWREDSAAWCRSSWGEGWRRRRSSFGLLKMIRFAASLGETCTTVSHPAKTSHRSLSEGEREEAGIYGGLIRMSCGVESAEDIEEDLGQALEEPVEWSGRPDSNRRQACLEGSEAILAAGAGLSATNYRRGRSRLYARQGVGLQPPVMLACPTLPACLSDIKALSGSRLCSAQAL